MRIVESNAVMMEHDMHPYRFIEKVARVCYKSEDKITDGSDIAMLMNLKKRKHYAMFEHEYAYFEFESTKTLNYFIEDTVAMTDDPAVLKYFNMSYKFMSCSFRALLDLFERIKGYPKDYNAFELWSAIYDKLFDKYPEIFGDEDIRNELNAWGSSKRNTVQLLSREEFTSRISQYPISAEKIDLKCLPYTIHFTCDRGISHELVRHRPCSFAQESTRYCNYNLGKFGQEITVIKPLFYEEGTEKFNIWKEACEQSEKSYLALINSGSVAQEARSVLPNSLKTEIVVTATAEEWQHIVNLRYWGKTGKPHPQMQEVMNIAYELLKAANGSIQ